MGPTDGCCAGRGRPAHGRREASAGFLSFHGDISHQPPSVGPPRKALIIGACGSGLATVSVRYCGVEALADCRKSSSRTSPSELFHRLKQRDFCPKRGKFPEQKCVILFPTESRRERARTGRIHVPCTPVPGNILQMLVFREYGRSRPCSPAGEPGIPVRGVAHQREVIGNRRRPHSELRKHTVLI